MLHREGEEDWAPSSLHLKFMVHRSDGRTRFHYLCSGSPCYTGGWGRPGSITSASEVHGTQEQWGGSGSNTSAVRVHGTQEQGGRLSPITPVQLARGLPGILVQDCLIWYLLTSPELLITHIFIFKVNHQYFNIRFYVKIWIL